MKIGNRRAPFIDYTKPGIFLITINKLKDLEPFSRLVCESMFPEEIIGVRYYDLGFIIYHAIKNFKAIIPDIEVKQYVIMPDHLHILIQIIRPLEHPLGDYIAIFKRKIFTEATQASIPLKGNRSVFETGFNDQFLRWGRNLNVIYDYIRENPMRLWKIKQDPGYFSRVNDRIINGRHCSLYGNLNHLENPFISEVIIHRRDTLEELSRKKEFWRYVLANGGVLAGAFVSEAEKEIFDGAARYGGRIILVSNKAMAKKEKPSKKLFNLCSKGQLLIITPELPVPISEKGISRAECLHLNAFAEELSRMRGGVPSVKTDFRPSADKRRDSDKRE